MHHGGLVPRVRDTGALADITCLRFVAARCLRTVPSSTQEPPPKRRPLPMPGATPKAKGSVARVAGGGPLLKLKLRLVGGLGLGFRVQRPRHNLSGDQDGRGPLPGYAGDVDEVDTVIHEIAGTVVPREREEEDQGGRASRGHGKAEEPKVEKKEGQGKASKKAEAGGPKVEKKEGQGKAKKAAAEEPKVEKKEAGKAKKADAEEPPKVEKKGRSRSRGRDKGSDRGGGGGGDGGDGGGKSRRRDRRGSGSGGDDGGGKRRRR